MKKIKLDLGPRAYEIWVGHDLFPRAARELRQGASAPKAFVFFDRKVAGVSRRLASALREDGWNVTLIGLAAGEALKEFPRIFPLYGQVLEAGGDRSSVFFAVGGGVIGDVVGFLAGTFLRGVRWVGVPTTLVAQVDSSIGGKTGINHPRGKNLIGAFHQPSLVLCDLSTLATLPRREVVSGLGEIVKYGIISERAFFRELARAWPKLLALDPVTLARVVAACARAKARVVEQDELDRRGIRDALNFGHTVGHALESVTHYQRYRHGEAIVLGMRVAVALSVAKGHLAHARAAEMDGLLAELPVPGYPPGIAPARLLPFIRQDKKKSSGRVRFVLLEDFGRIRLDSSVTDAQILAALEVIRA